MNRNQQSSKSTKKEKSASSSSSARTDDGDDLDAIKHLPVQKEKRVTVKAEPKDKRRRNNPPASKVSDPDSVHFKLPLDGDDDKPLFKRSDAKKGSRKDQQKPASPSPSDVSDLDTEEESILAAHGLDSSKRSPTPMQFSPISEVDPDEIKIIEERMEKDKELIEQLRLHRMEEKPAKPLSKLYDILADIKEEIIVPLAKTSGIHKIEESTISSIKTKNNFKSADFDTFKTINLSLLPKPKFKLLGKADRRALGMESTSSAQATNGKQEEDEQDDRGERMHDITTVKQVKDRQTTASNGWITLAKSNSLYGDIVGSEGKKHHARNSAIQSRGSDTITSAFVNIRKDPEDDQIDGAPSESMQCTVKVDFDFNHCWTSSGRRATNGPMILFTLATTDDPAGLVGWAQLAVDCSVLDKRSHFSIESFAFNGPSATSDRSKYGPTFLDAVCIFLADMYECADYPPPKEIRWDLQTLDCPKGPFKPSTTVRRELLNNSEIVQFLSCTFESTNGNMAFAKRLH